MTPDQSTVSLTGIPAELLDRYLAGECAPEEAERVRAWIATDVRREGFAHGPLGRSHADPALDQLWGSMAARAVQAALRTNDRAGTARGRVPATTSRESTGTRTGSSATQVVRWGAAAVAVVALTAGLAPA